MRKLAPVFLTTSILAFAAGNALRKRDLPQLRLKVAHLAQDEAEHPLVRETARQVAQALACVRGG